MTAILCVALAIGAGTCERGGHAATVPLPPPRGGHALAVLEPVGDVAAWLCIHNGTPVAGGEPYTVGQGEGPWNAEGYYEGGLQMDHGFSTTYGADMWRKYGAGPHAWTPREQMVVAERARSSGRGYYPWPNTARDCGLI